MLALNIRKKIQYGFTLLELTIGIAVLSVALTVMTGALFPQADRSTEPWFQVRSAELAHSMMNEILARKFDENNFVLGNLRCGEFETGATTSVPCVTQNALNTCTSLEAGETSTNRSTYDDVDDFNCTSLSAAQLTDLTGNQSLANQYEGFQVQVDVSYLTVDQVKLITVTVTPPRGGDIVYSAYKANY